MLVQCLCNSVSCACLGRRCLLVIHYLHPGQGLAAIQMIIKALISQHIYAGCHCSCNGSLQESYKLKSKENYFFFAIFPLASPGTKSNLEDSQFATNTIKFKGEQIYMTTLVRLGAMKVTHNKFLQFFLLQATSKENRKQEKEEKLL